MNILVISTLFPSRSGQSYAEVTSTLYFLARHWTGEHRVEAVVPRYRYLRDLLRRPLPSGPFRRDVALIGKIRTVTHAVWKVPRLKYCYAPLQRYLDRMSFKPDIVVAHFDKGLQVGYQFARRHGLPLAAGLHVIPELQDPDPRPFIQGHRQILEYASIIACRSPFILDRVGTIFPHLRGKCVPVYSGIPRCQITEPGHGSAKIRAWKEKKKIRIATVAHLILRKNINVLIDALAGLDTDFDWQLNVIGHGPERPNLEKQCLARRCRQKVVFPGSLPRQEVLAALRESDLFILASTLETFGLCYLEAMAAGNIVIGSKGEGIDGIIRHGENGFLCTPGNSPELTELVRYILKRDEKELCAISDRARDSLQDLDEERIAGDYLQQLTRTVGKHAAGHEAEHDR